MDQSLTTPKSIAECGGDKRHWNNPWCADRGTSMARNGTVENADLEGPIQKAVDLVPPEQYARFSLRGRTG